MTCRDLICALVWSLHNANQSYFGLIFIIIVYINSALTALLQPQQGHSRCERVHNEAIILPKRHEKIHERLFLIFQDIQTLESSHSFSKYECKKLMELHNNDKCYVSFVHKWDAKTFFNVCWRNWMWNRKYVPNKGEEIWFCAWNDW